MHAIAIAAVECWAGLYSITKGGKRLFTGFSWIQTAFLSDNKRPQKFTYQASRDKSWKVHLESGYLRLRSLSHYCLIERRRKRFGIPAPRESRSWSWIEGSNWEWHTQAECTVQESIRGSVGRRKARSELPRVCTLWGSHTGGGSHRMWFLRSSSRPWGRDEDKLAGGRAMSRHLCLGWAWRHGGRRWGWLSKS